MDTYYTYVLRDGEDGSLRQIPRMLQGGYEEGEGWSNMVMLHIRAIIIFSSSILTGSLETSFFFRSHSNTSSYSMCIYTNIDDTNPVLFAIAFLLSFQRLSNQFIFLEGGDIFCKTFFLLWLRTDMNFALNVIVLTFRRKFDCSSHGTYYLYKIVAQNMLRTHEVK